MLIARGTPKIFSGNVRTTKRATQLAGGDRKKAEVVFLEALIFSSITRRAESASGDPGVHVYGAADRVVSRTWGDSSGHLTRNGKPRPVPL